MKHHLVFLTGAGISQESGLATFRESNGLWINYKIEAVASPESFANNPQLILDFYNQRWLELKTIQPNAAHFMLADLEKKY